MIDWARPLFAISHEDLSAHKPADLSARGLRNQDEENWSISHCLYLESFWLKFIWSTNLLPLIICRLRQRRVSISIILIYRPHPFFIPLLFSSPDSLVLAPHAPAVDNVSSSISHPISAKVKPVSTIITCTCMVQIFETFVCVCVCVGLGWWHVSHEWHISTCTHARTHTHRHFASCWVLQSR